MFLHKKNKTFLFVLAALLFFTACRKLDAGQPDTLIVFETNEQGLAATDTAITVKLKLTQGVKADIPVTLTLNEQGVVYGIDYITIPAAQNGKIILTVPSGNNETSFIIKKMPGVLLDGDEKVVVDLYSSGNPVLIGVTKQFTLGFAELIATNAEAVIDGGGVLFPNKVFIDLSANRETPIQRTSFDLGFYNGADDYRVTLNSATGMLAKQIAKNDLNAVTATDTLGFSNEVVISQTEPVPASLNYVDYPNGELSRTAIAAISATASDNKVYIVNMGYGIGNPAPARGWKKIRIIRNASGGYTLQHADISATTFTSIDVPKDDTYFFKYVSFANGIVSVEPQKKKWDIVWTYFTNTTNFGNGEVPYMYQDVVLINRNIKIAKVMVTPSVTFQGFGVGDISSLTLQTAQNAIAADWRSGGGPGTSPAVRSDRFYVLKDGDGNWYKLQFTALTQNGVRGYPAYKAVWLKKE